MEQRIREVLNVPSPALRRNGMNELPPEAQRALALGPGERVQEAWPAVHRKGNATQGLANLADGMEGFLVLTSSRLMFLAGTGGRFSRTYQSVPPLSWGLATLAEAIQQPGALLGGHTVWFQVRGEYFSVGKGAGQENGRAQWAIERARSAAMAMPRAPAGGAAWAPTSAAPAPPGPVTASVPPVRAAEPYPPGASGRPEAATGPRAERAVPAASTWSSTPSSVQPQTVPPSSPAMREVSGPNATRPPAPVPTQGPGLSRPGAPSWPMVPMTLVETADANAFWSIVGSSGVDRGKMLIFCTEAPAELSASYGLAGATLWRISSNEGESRVRPGDVDRVGDLVSGHLEKETGRAVVLKGLDRVIEDAGFRSARKLLEVAREAAERTRGAVIVHADPVLVSPKELHQLEDDVKVLKV